MYYKIPFDLSNVLEGGDAPACNMHESIAQHLYVLITTRSGENRFDNSYGNSIWDLEFENGISNAQWEEWFIQAVTNGINSYEKRLTNVDVKIHSSMIERTWPMRNYVEVKKKVVVFVSAIINSTGEKYTFKTELFLSPMSVD
jgi:phage baseplate assembly protein W